MRRDERAEKRSEKIALKYCRVSDEERAEKRSEKIALKCCRVSDDDRGEKRGEDRGYIDEMGERVEGRKKGLNEILKLVVKNAREEEREEEKKGEKENEGKMHVSVRVQLQHSHYYRFDLILHAFLSILQLNFPLKNLEAVLGSQIPDNRSRYYSYYFSHCC